MVCYLVPTHPGHLEQVSIPTPITYQAQGSAHNAQGQGARTHVARAVDEAWAQGDARLRVLLK